MTARPAPVLDRLGTLADATRSRLLLLLEGTELTVGELCTITRLPQSTVSRHLRILSDDGWVSARDSGASRFYILAPGRLDAFSRRLWQVVRDQVSSTPATQQDVRRRESVLTTRRGKAQTFFNGAAGGWDAMRADLIGARTDLLALLDLLDDGWTVADLGCGTGPLSAALAPVVRRVVAVDESAAMLSAARKRLAAFDNVEVKSGSVEAIPVRDGEIDVALLFLVAHYLAEPRAAFEEVRRALRSGGRLLVVDLTPHEHEELAEGMGHVWRGFSEEQMRAWLLEAGLRVKRYRVLPADPRAKGPALFSLVAEKGKR